MPYRCGDLLDEPLGRAGDAAIRHEAASRTDVHKPKRVGLMRTNPTMLRKTLSGSRSKVTHRSEESPYEWRSPVGVARDRLLLLAGTRM